MADIQIKWSCCEDLSIRESALDCGFNLSTLNLSGLSKDRSKWIVDEVTKYILDAIESCWEDDNPRIKFGDVKNGIYVISFGGNMCIGYENGESQVLYIGQGKIKSRLKKHLRSWVMNFSESLQDMCLTFNMAKVVVRNSRTPHKEVESDFIEKFIEKFGEKPILNSIRGVSHNKYHKYTRASSRPLHKKQGVSYGWKMSPMPKNDWFRELKG
ncbi:MAG: hypothetical protein V7744_08815 [Pseudomonadales bacterium]